MPNGKPASSTDPDTWATFEKAMESASQYAGIGYVFSQSDPYIGIDLDGCRDASSGVIADWAKELIVQLDSYTEISPSQTGVKIWVRSPAPFSDRTGRKVNVNAPAIGAKVPGIEMYSHGRFFAVTGWLLKHSVATIEERSEQVAAIRDRFFSEAAKVPAARPIDPTPVIERASRYLAKLDAAVAGSGGHNSTFHAACVLVRGFELSEDAALSLLVNEYNPRCQPAWSERELQHKVRSAAKAGGPTGYLRDAPMDQWQSISVPSYRQQEPSYRGESKIDITTASAAVEKYIESIEAGKTNLVDTGLPDVDYALGGGVEPGEMVILAARPSHGKSLCAMQCLDEASKQGKPSAIVSEEMSSLALGKRSIQYASAIPTEHWPTRIAELRKTMRAHFAERAPIYIVENAGTIDRVIETLRRLVAEKGVQVAAVDYAQLLGGQSKTAYERSSETSRKLKAVAKETGIVLFVLCQLSRAIENRKVFMPAMQDIRESGQFEQDADVILFLVWEHRIDPTRPREQFKIYVAKNRNRPTHRHCVGVNINPGRQRLEPGAVGEYAYEFDEYNQGNNKDMDATTV